MRRLLALLALSAFLTPLGVFGREAPYSDAALQQLRAAGKPCAVVFHADWCPTCRAQAPILKQLAETRDLAPLTILVADFDQDLAARKALGVTRQSTLVVFKAGKEVARSTGITDRAGLEAQLRQGLP